MFKNNIKIALALSVATSLYSYEGILNHDANLRLDPSLSASIIKVHQKDEKIDILKIAYSNGESWYKTNDGYIHSSLVKTSDSNIKRVNDNARVRVEPDLNSAILGILYKNQVVKTISKDGDWYKTEGGYIHSSLLDDLETITPTEIAIEKTKSQIVAKKVPVEIEIKEETIKSKQTETKVVSEEVKTNQEKPLENKLSQNSNSNRYFIDISVGYSSISTQKRDDVGSFTLAREIDDKGYNYSLGLGYYYNKNYFTTISYENSIYDDVEFHNYLLSINRVFNFSNFNPYIGLIAGVSFIELTKSHINSDLPDKKGKEYTFGAKAGVDYTINDDMSFYSELKYLYAKHETTLSSPPAQSTIIRDNQVNMNLGLRYKF